MSGFSLGVVVTVFFVAHGWQLSRVIQRTFGYFFAITYVLLQVYTVVTQGQPLDWFFSATGLIVVGYVLGINVAEHLPTLSTSYGKNNK